MPEEIIPPRFTWDKEFIEARPWLPLPAEAFDIAKDETMVIRVSSWDLYKHLIHPTWYPPGVMKLTLALRVWLYPGYGFPRAPYLDIHQGHLISQLIPILQEPDFTKLEITITKRREAPKARFQVSVKPVA